MQVKSQELASLRVDELAGLPASWQAGRLAGRRGMIILIGAL